MRTRVKRHNTIKHFLSLLLVWTMTVAFLPASALADEGEAGTAGSIVAEDSIDIEYTMEDTIEDSMEDTLQEEEVEIDSESEDIEPEVETAADELVTIKFSPKQDPREFWLFDGVGLRSVSTDDFSCSYKSKSIKISRVVWEKSSDGYSWEDVEEGELANGDLYYCLFFVLEQKFPFTTKIRCEGISQVTTVLATPSAGEVRFIMPPVGPTSSEAYITRGYDGAVIGYPTIAEAFSQVRDNDKVTVGKDFVELNNDITLDKDITLDLNGHSLILKAGKILTIGNQKKEGSCVLINSCNSDDPQGGIYLIGTLNVVTSLDYSSLEVQQAGGIITITESDSAGSIHLEKDSLVTIPEIKGMVGNNPVQMYADTYPALMTCEIGATAQMTGSQRYISETEGTSQTPGVWKDQTCVITEQPVDWDWSKRASADYGHATFTVVAEYAGSYQWYFRNENDSKKTWYMSKAKGADTATLSNISVYQGSIHNIYRCKVTGKDGKTILYSNEVRIINWPPSPSDDGTSFITEQPEYALFALGTKTSFHVTAEDATAYQWYYSKDNGDRWYKSTASGATTDTVSITASLSNKSMIYRCKVTDSNGTVMYSEAAGFYEGFSILRQPVSVRYDPGKDACFTVKAACAVSYQWYYSKNGGNTWYKSTADGANTASVTVKMKSTNSEILYRCKLKSQEGDILYTDNVGFTQ